MRDTEPKKQPATANRAWPEWPVVLFAAGAPGLLAGVQLTGLLFFLNPDLPFTLAPFLRGVARYGSLGVAASVLLHLPWTWGRPHRARRLLPWTVTAVLALAALGAWRHAAYFAYYLPQGINVRLLKAALWLSLGAVMTFYTALLHSWRGKPYGWRSRSLLWLMAAAAVYAVVERRESFRAPLPVPPRSAEVERLPRPRLWVVGVDTLTLDAILPLAEQGRLPFFRQMIEQGAIARLRALRPVRRSPLWTTLATGSYPHRHGLLGPDVHSANFLATGAALKLLPQGILFDRWGLLGSRERPAVRPRKSLTSLWDVLPGLGVETGVIAWPGLHPLPEAPRFAVAERFFATDGGAGGAARPDDFARRARLFRADPRTFDGSARSPFGGAGPVPEHIAAALAGDAWRESLSFFALEQIQELGAGFVVLPGFYSISRNYYGGFAATSFDGSLRQDDHEAERWVAGYLGHLDSYLGELWRRMAPPRVLAVVSPYGVEAAGGWRAAWGKLDRSKGLRGLITGAPDGALLVLGDGVQPSASLPEGARIVDVVPTFAYTLGIPVARDQDGKVLTSIFAPSFLARQPLVFVPSYEGLPTTDVNGAEVPAPPGAAPPI